MMNRRSFLRRTAAAVVALTLARHLPGIASTVILPPPREDSNLGISMRYIKEFDIAGPVHRFDVVFGMGCIAPNTVVRVQG
jgi:hypothetical protein